MAFRSSTKILAERMLEYCRVSWCVARPAAPIIVFLDWCSFRQQLDHDCFPTSQNVFWCTFQ